MMLLTSGEDFVEFCRKVKTERKYQQSVSKFDFPLPILPRGWVWASLSEVAERVSVGHVGPTTQFFSESGDGIPFVRSQDVRPGKLQIENVAYITPQFHAKLKKSRLKAGDLLIVRVGVNRGDVCVVPKGLGELNCANIVFSRLIDPNGFVGFYFQSNYGRNILLSITTGSAQGVLNTQTVARLPIPVPPLSTQRKIAAILSAYDDLIENNRRRITLLERMAEEIYCEWFVRMRFPGHEQVKFEKGVPDGWELLRLSDIYTTSSGGTPSRENLNHYNGNIPWIKTGELNNTFILDTEEKITEEGLQNSSAKLFPRHTVLIAMYGATIGELGILSIEATTNQACCAFIPKLPYLKHVYTFHLMKSLKDSLISFSFGGAQQNISQELIKNFRITLPKAETIELFVNQTNYIYDELEIITKAQSVLRKTRDLLLGRLISGMLSVESLDIQSPPRMVDDAATDA